MVSGQEIWNDVRETLKKKLAPTTFNQSFENVTKIDHEENGVIFILVDSEFIKHNINRTHMENINNIIEKKNYGRKVKLKFITENDKQAQAIKPQEAFTPLRSNNLNLNYTFESFVTGESNRNAFLSASKVADTPGVYVNPLYIFGGVGLGKTHLMQAIGNYISDMNVENKIVYVQANDFVKDFQQGTMDKNMKAFDDKYDNADILLIDDIQMLSSKPGSQNQFFNLFQSMMDRSKQVVITSDVPPNKLNGFMDRLTSRFQMGYQVNINQPDFPQRMQILRRKAAEKTQLRVPDDVLSYIAEIFTDNVRELEGALNRVIVYCDLTNNDNITLDFAKEALDILVKSRNPQETTYESCISVVANAYGISTIDILGASRSAKIVLPRHIVMYILKKKYGLQYTKIGAILNGKDHTTIMNGVDRIENEIKTNEELKMAVEGIMKKL
ncbi:MAG: chromosomal replication initiator protein DnaA [Acholeplasmatales bacterium]|nr:chromosomal replication initiator protein DnaA [Acholeplasmatales bacterium]